MEPSNDDAWEAVFALAGRSVDDFPEPCPAPISDGGIPSRKKRKRRHAAHTLAHDDANNSAAASVHGGGYQTYLEERSSTRIVWPSWMLIREGFNPRRCAHWSDSSSTRHSASNEGRSLSETADNFAAGCGTCRQSPIHHVACAITKGIQTTPSQQLFLAVRNLRCVAVQRALAIPNEASLEVPKNVVERLCDEWRHGTARLQTLRSDVPESLLLACQQVDTRTLLRVQSTKASSTSSLSDDKAWEQAVRLVISLDNVYFRLYYSHLSRELPLSNGDGDSGLPHPLSYFGLVAVDMNEYKHRARKLVASLAAATGSSNAKMTRLLFDRFGLVDDSDGWQLENSALPNGGPALVLLHRFRMLETIAMFRSWSDRPYAHRQLVASCSAVVEPHETPAPEILMRWRDSCRDFLCHLYSYATLPHATLDRLRGVLLDHKVSRVLELGAGTGYLAQLLNERVSGDGIFVEAVDLHPPAPLSSFAASERNEYHGDTPPFYTITSGSESTILARRRCDMPRTALLLCYPPPDSSFAYDALRTFTECEGQLVVFVGEFKGLTGNANFERLLQSQYACVDRLPCMCWVTDASMVTVWERIAPMPIGVPLPLLLPCSSCGVAESTKRCRLLRCLSYCSRRCFDSHAAHRAVALELVMVKFGVGGGLDFNSNLHFAKLSSL
jgi:hypothetical protein